jgi:hypothetical protein
MTDRQTLALYLALILFGILGTVAQHYGYFPQADITFVDNLATLGWALVPLFLCLVLFFVARLLKTLAVRADAQTWAIRDDNKRCRETHRAWMRVNG